MNINILRYSLFGIAGGQEVDHNFSYGTVMSLTIAKQLVVVTLRLRFEMAAGYNCTAYKSK